MEVIDHQGDKVRWDRCAVCGNHDGIVLWCDAHHQKEHVACHRLLEDRGEGSPLHSILIFKQ